MYLNEINKESSIQISVGIGLQVLEFNTKVCEVLENGVFAEPIMKEEKMLGFGTKGLVIQIFAVNQADSKVYQFNHVQIRNVKTSEGNLFHEITCKSEGRPVNRRNACRVWLGLDGEMQVGLGKKSYNVLIKDISVNGIAFVCRSDVAVDLGSVVRLTFFDDTTKTKFNIGSIVVRSEQLEQYKVMYGCKLNQESTAISKYVNDKQREKLRATRSLHAIPLEKKK